MGTPSMSFAVGTLVLVAILLVVLVLLDVWKRKAGPVTKANAKNIGIGALLVAAAIGGLCYYQNRKEQEASKPSENAVKYERMAKRARGEAVLSLEAFHRLSDGMSYSEACTILGRGGKLMSSTKLEGLPRTEMYEWSEGTEIVTCTFQNDKLVSKAQSGLW